MKKIYLGTNWKMHKTYEEAIQYTKELIQLASKFKDYQFFIIPPFTHLRGLKEILKDTDILLGAQNMHWEDEGAYTGEISPKMLSEIGIDIIEIGHSERRQYYNETDFTVNNKVKAALKYGFIPLICIGEHMADKEKNVSKEVLSRQIKIALDGVKEKEVNNLWIAYEPVWAIGEKGVPAEPEYINEIHSYIRKILMNLYSNGDKIPIFYGGSVNINNSVESLRIKDVNGLFIGRSAWNTDSFHNIMQRVKDNEVDI